MTRPITVTFHGMRRSTRIEADIRRRLAKLAALCDEILWGHVVVDVPHRHHVAGNRFGLRILLGVPREEIAVSHAANLHAASRHFDEHEWTKRFDVEATRKDLRVVIRDAFEVARRRVQDYERRRWHKGDRRTRSTQKIRPAASGVVRALERLESV